MEVLLLIYYNISENRRQLYIFMSAYHRQICLFVFFSIFPACWRMSIIYNSWGGGMLLMQSLYCGNKLASWQWLNWFTKLFSCSSYLNEYKITKEKILHRDNKQPTCTILFFQAPIINRQYKYLFLRKKSFLCYWIFSLKHRKTQFLVESGGLMERYA